LKGKHNAGYSLIETLVAITVLAIIVVPTCTGMVMSFQLNAKAHQLMQAELAVSSAVEQLMAEGITAESAAYDIADGMDRFPRVRVETRQTLGKPYYNVTVTSNNGEVTVETAIRKTVG